MPIVDMTLTETEQSISRPIIIDVVNQLKNIFKINTDPRVIYTGDIKKNLQSGTSIDNNDHNALLATDRYLFISVDTDYEMDSLYSTAINKTEHLPVFLDSDLDVVIKPVYTNMTVNIDVNYRTHSKTEALRWRDDVRAKIANMRDIHLLDITYHYPIPNVFINLLEVIYNARNNVLGYGDTFKDYITKCSSTRLNLASDLVNKNNALVVSEKQCRIIGRFTSDTLPDKPEKEESSTWVIKFTYTFQYQKPIECSMRYPIIVHNQVLPRDYIAFTNKAYNLKNIIESRSVSLQAYKEFETDTILNKALDGLDHIPLPLYDDFVLHLPFPGTKTIFVALCQFERPDTKTLINLNQLDPIMIDKYFLEFIKTSEGPFLGKMYQSIINVCLYEGNNQLGTIDLNCNNDLVISSPVNLDPRKVYHVRFSIVTDLTFLSVPALLRLRNFRGNIFLLIPNIMKYLGKYGGYLKGYRGTSLNFPPTWDNKDIINVLLSLLPPVDWTGFSGQLHFKTVQNSYVVAIKPSIAEQLKKINYGLKQLNNVGSLASTMLPQNK